MTPFFGYHMPSFSFPDATDETRFERLVTLACAAEEAGFDLVTVMDHFYQIGVHGSEEEPMLRPTPRFPPLLRGRAASSWEPW